MNTHTRVKEVEAFCSELVKEYLPGYRFVVNPRLKTTNGRILYGQRRIEMSYFLASQGQDKDILNNVLHEIAHGMNPTDGHGRAWRNTFIKLGGDGRRTNSYEGIDYERKRLPVKYKIDCVKCGQIASYRKRPKIADSLYRCSCRRCGGRDLTFGEV